VTAERYDIAAFVRKMEQLYVLLCDGSRARRPGAGARRSGPICRFWHEPRAVMNHQSRWSHRRRCSSKAGTW
jgi:hypothetical protein